MYDAIVRRERSLNVAKRWYGSLNNRIDEQAVKGQPMPVVGMGATILLYSDRRAATIELVEIGKTFVTLSVRTDKATRTDSNGMSESQTYVYERDASGATMCFRARVDAKGRPGQWRQSVKRGKRLVFRDGGSGLKIGVRNEYHDFSF